MSGQENDADSALDNSNFLSFEEWKRKNLAKAGQSAENLGARSGGAGTEQRRRPGTINNALDSLGEDTEIDINFGGFVNSGPMGTAIPSQRAGNGGAGPVTVATESTESQGEELANTHRRGKDAGKTCKERSNYASFDCAATMLKTNPECKGSSAVLVENKDSYMLNTCSAKNKFLIVELCDDILIDTVVLANFEFFSSMFRTFRVSVSDRYPVKLDKWKELGTFEAKNSREVQAFLVENPLIWARYLRVEYLTHFGNEYYCPVSLLRVHGTTMMEEFNQNVKGARGEDEPDNEPSGAVEGEGLDSIPDVVSAEALKVSAPATSLQIETISTSITTLTTALVNDAPSTAMIARESPHPPKPTMSANGFTPNVFSVSRRLEDLLLSPTDFNNICMPSESPVKNSPEATSATTIESQAMEILLASNLSSTAVTVETSPPQSEVLTLSITKAVESPALSATPNAPVSDAINSVSQNSTKSLDQILTSNVKVQTSITQPAAANPTTQESFFKSVHKRLQLLESNSTLSLQYIEEQSRILREAFSKVEKRQLAKTSAFLEALNTTVLTELRDFRTQYDQIWQSTVLELSSQREQSQHEVLALSARLTLLADEIVFQKRMAILQFALILLCLGLVIFSRHGSPAGTHLELPPLVQNAISKSSVNLSRYTTSLETPPTSPSSTRPSSRYGLFSRGLNHHRCPSEESDLNAGAKSPVIEYSPPTPESQHSGLDGDGSPGGDALNTNRSDDPPDAEDDAFRQTRSSPTTPSGKREEQRELVEGSLLRPDGTEENGRVERYEEGHA